MILLTFRAWFNECRVAWNDALFHGHDCFHESRDTSRWLRVPNIALDLDKDMR